MPVFKCATVCLSNMNRSMEGHKQLYQSGFKVSSYGVGRMVTSLPFPHVRPTNLQISQVTLPGEDRKPNVFEFGTSYKDILAKLEERGLDRHVATRACLYQDNTISLLGTSILGARTSEKCWNATRSSRGPLSVGRTIQNSESSIKSIALEPPSLCTTIANTSFAGTMWSLRLTMKCMTWCY